MAKFYATSIAIFFQGSRAERSILAMQNIGPAVLNGGFSTFLALVLLATSDAYVFIIFFKVSKTYLRKSYIIISTKYITV
jgi:hypothetical protein